MAADRKEIAALKAKIRELERMYQREIKDKLQNYERAMARYAVQQPQYVMTYSTAAYYPTVGSTVATRWTTATPLYSPSAAPDPEPPDTAPCDPEPKQERQPIVPPGLNKPPVDDAELM